MIKQENLAGREEKNVKVNIPAKKGYCMILSVGDRELPRLLTGDSLYPAGPIS